MDQTSVAFGGSHDLGLALNPGGLQSTERVEFSFGRRGDGLQRDFRFEFRGLNSGHSGGQTSVALGGLMAFRTLAAYNQQNGLNFWTSRRETLATLYSCLVC